MSSEEAIFQHAAKPNTHSLATVPLASKSAVAGAPGLKISLLLSTSAAAVAQLSGSPSNSK